MAGQIMPNPPLLAVDTNFLIDLAAGDEVALDCLSTLRRKLPTAPILVLPTVIQELVYIASRSDIRRPKILASKALQSILKPWGFRPVNCVPVGHGIVEETARKIRAAGLLPEEEINDSFIIAESALAHVTLLISSDSHLKNIDHRKLKAILDRCDLTDTVITSPWKIVHDFFASVH
jgi:predicted nucleic acid-binding protein